MLLSSITCCVWCLTPQTSLRAHFPPRKRAAAHRMLSEPVLNTSSLLATPLNRHAAHSSLGDYDRVRARRLHGTLLSAGAETCLCQLGTDQLIQPNASSTFVHTCHCCATGRSCCKAPQRCCVAGLHNLSTPRGQARPGGQVRPPPLRARRTKRAARERSRLNDIIAVTLAVIFAAALVACANLAFPCRAGHGHGHDAI